jgi:ribulose-5-phosphate 4-epimerase/fuculose-1-phosphate aldolase
MSDQEEGLLYDVPAVAAARADLALALRAAAHYGLGEGICNHFSLAVPGDTGRFLLNPQGLLWGTVGAADIVMADARGRRVAGKHAVEPTAMILHAAVHNVLGAPCVLHSHMPYATALCLLEGEGFDTLLSQNALRFHGRVRQDIGYGGLALDAAEGERIAWAMRGHDVGFLSNHGVIVTGPNLAEAFEDLYYLERAAMVQVLSMSTGKAGRAIPGEIGRRAAEQLIENREQAHLFFEALRRLLPEG